MGKIISIDTVPSVMQTIQDPIILAGGCFDVIHPGHITFLKKAKEIGGTLVVLLESDEKIRALKGDNRPIYSQSDRAFMLSHLDMVDYVIPLPFFNTHDEYEQLVLSINPQYFAVTKDDPVLHYIRPQATKINAKIVEVVDRIDRYASSHVIKELNI